VQLRADGEQRADQEPEPCWPVPRSERALAADVIPIFVPELDAIAVLAPGPQQLDAGAAPQPAEVGRHDYVEAALSALRSPRGHPGDSPQPGIELNQRRSAGVAGAGIVAAASGPQLTTRLANLDQRSQNLPLDPGDAMVVAAEADQPKRRADTQALVEFRLSADWRDGLDVRGARQSNPREVVQIIPADGRQAVVGMASPVVAEHDSTGEQVVAEEHPHGLAGLGIEAMRGGQHQVGGHERARADLPS